MSSVGEDKASEAGGLQGAAQSLGSSLGTALIGAILLAGLTTGLHDAVRADSSIPPDVQEADRDRHRTGGPDGLQRDGRAAGYRGGPASRSGRRRRRPLRGRRRSTRSSGRSSAASFFALFAFWIAGDLPGAPLGARRRIGAEPARARPSRQADTVSSGIMSSMCARIRWHRDPDRKASGADHRHRDAAGDARRRGPDLAL